MKSIFCTFLLTVFYVSIFAQHLPTHLYYLSGELNIGNLKGGNLNLEYVHNGKTAFKLGFLSTITNASNQPSDYPAMQAKPVDQFAALYLTAGKIVYPFQSRKLRFNLAIGPAFALQYIPNNFYKSPNTLTPDFYQWETEKTRFPGLVIHPELEMPLHKYFGFSLSPMFVLGTKASYYGISLGAMIGKLKVE